MLKILGAPKAGQTAQFPVTGAPASVNSLPAGILGADGTALITAATVSPSVPAVQLSPELYNATQNNTRHLRAAVTRVLAGQGDGRLAFVGDSTMAGSYAVSGANGGATNGKPNAMPAQLAKILAGRGIPSQDDSWFGNYATALFSGLTTMYPAVTSGVGFSQALSTIAGSAWLSTASGSTINFQPVSAFDTIDFYVVQNSGFGSFTYAVDGGATLGTVNTANTPSLYKRYTVTGIAHGTHTINIATTSTASVYICGIAVRDSTQSKMLANNLGIIASTAASWAAINASNYGYLPAMAALAPDCTFINLTINDIVNNTESIATYKSNMQGLINGALATGDVVLMVGNPGLNANFSNSVGANFVAAVYALAVSNNLPLIDITAKWISEPAAAAYGLYGDANEHPSAIGYADIAASVAKLLL